MAANSNVIKGLLEVGSGQLPHLGSKAGAAWPASQQRVGRARREPRYLCSRSRPDGRHGLGCFRRIEVAGHAHTVLQTAGGRPATEVDGARWVNVLLSNLKRALDSVYHAIRQSKYAGPHLAEAAYRFNRGFKRRRIAGQLAADLMSCKPCPEQPFAFGEQLCSLRFGANQVRHSGSQ